MSLPLHTAAYWWGCCFAAFRSHSAISLQLYCTDHGASVLSPGFFDSISARSELFLSIHFCDLYRIFFLKRKEIRPNISQTLKMDKAYKKIKTKRNKDVKLMLNALASYLVLWSR